MKTATVAPFALTAACSAPRATASPRKPRNLLVLLSDDQSGRDVGCYGNTSCITPNIDALARDGVRFERAYTSVGVCQPSRSSLYTGLYPTRHGATGFGPVRDDVATWPEILRERDIATAMIGKLDVDPLRKFPFEFLVKAKDMPSRSDPAQFERYFREFLASAGERRFAAVVAFHDPHRPFEEEAPEKPSIDPSSLAVPASLWDTPDTRLDLARYYDCVARLDRGVGRVLAALGESGRAADTLVIFTSDNGASFPFAKSTLYEAGVRMPFIARGPGVRRAVSDEFVSLLDVLPTALEVFEVQPRELDGQSLLPLLRGERAFGRDSFVSMQTDNLGGESFPSRALHERRWKYIRNFRADAAAVTNVVGHTLTWESGKVLARTDERVARRMESYIYRPSDELYDLERDPCELLNLASDAQHSQRLDELRGKLRAWLSEHDDPMLASWSE